MASPRERRPASLLPPLCHPEEPYYAAGLCRRCYAAARRQRETPAGGGSGHRVVDPRAPAAERPARRVAVPGACPKCKAQILRFIGGGLAGPRELSCLTCGWAVLVGREPG